MSRSMEELDFFGMEKERTTNHAGVVNFREISRINPEVLRRVIARGSTASAFKPFMNSSTAPATPITPQSTSTLFSNSPDHNPVSRNDMETAPMTVFYDGVVRIYDLPRHRAQAIVKIAAEASSKNGLPKITRDAPHGDMPIARRKSLQRFLEKRKERLIAVSPYCYGTGSTSDLAY
ncbi:TIFY 9-like protein [Drosera capensis]